MIEVRLKNFFEKPIPMWRVLEDEETDYLMCPKCQTVRWNVVTPKYCETCGQHFNGREYH